MGDRGVAARGGPGRPRKSQGARAGAGRERDRGHCQRQNRVKRTSTIASKKMNIELFPRFRRHSADKFIGFNATF